jgi:hypothetical protein
MLMTEVQLDNVTQTFEVSSDRAKVTIRSYDLLSRGKAASYTVTVLTANDICNIVEGMGHEVETGRPPAIFWTVHENHGLIGRTFFDRDQAVAHAKLLHTGPVGEKQWHEVYRHDGPGEPTGTFQLKPRDRVLASGKIMGWDEHRGRYDAPYFTGKCEHCGMTREGEYKEHLSGCPELRAAEPKGEVKTE